MRNTGIRDTTGYRRYSGRAAFFKAAGLCAVITFSLSFSACGLGGLGYGIIVWSPDQTRASNGELVKVVGKSDLSKTYTVESSDDKVRTVLEQWRVKVFGSRNEAEKFLLEFTPFANLFARANISALPVREKPDSDDDTPIVYKLRAQEILKILGRTTEQEIRVGNLTGFWYRVQTETGVEGYSFSSRLSVYDASAGGTPVLAAEERRDEKLERFLSNVWRPDYFRPMIESGRIDLDLFSPRFGIFPDPVSKTIAIVLPNQETSYSWTTITSSGSDSYSIDGTDFSFTVKDAFTSVRYSYNNTAYSAAFIVLEENLDELISAELTKRKELFDRFYEKGTVFISNAYGRVSLSPDQTFVWTGLDRLVPSVVPATAGQEGFVDFRFGLHPSIAPMYDGVISFRFAGAGNAGSVSFLYDFTQNGVKFVHVPGSNISGTQVMREPSTPTVIFFSYGG